MLGVLSHQSLPGGISYNSILWHLILPLEMFYSLKCYLAEIIGRFIIIHKSQIHETLLEPLYDLMADAFP